jgi:hypothetical protein
MIYYLTVKNGGPYMKIKKGFVLRVVGGENVVVPVGACGDEELLCPGRLGDLGVYHF